MLQGKKITQTNIKNGFQIKKTLEKKFEDNDIYILHIIDNTILINDNYVGIMLLNEKLEIIKNILIIQDMIINNVYTSAEKNEILLCCYENRSIVHVNLVNGLHKIISLEKHLGMSFSSFYVWFNNIVVIFAYASFVLINIDECSIQTISEQKVEKEFPDFYRFWKALRNYSVSNVDMDNKAFTYTNEELRQYVVCRYGSNEEHVISNCYNEEAHDLIYKNNVFMSVAEEQIMLCKNNKRIGIIKAQIPFYMLRARFLGKGISKLIVLSSYQNASLTLFELND